MFFIKWVLYLFKISFIQQISASICPIKYSFKTVLVLTLRLRRVWNVGCVSFTTYTAAIGNDNPCFGALCAPPIVFLGPAVRGVRRWEGTMLCVTNLSLGAVVSIQVHQQCVGVVIALNPCRS